MRLSGYYLIDNDVKKEYEDYTGYCLLPPNKSNCIYLDDVLKISYISRDTMGYIEKTIFSGKVLCKGKEICLKISSVEVKQSDIILSIGDFIGLNDLLLDYTNNFCKIEKIFNK